MRKRKGYQQVRCSADVLKQAVDTLAQIAEGEVAYSQMYVDVDTERWTYESPDEFYSAYRKLTGSASLAASLRPKGKQYPTIASLSVDTSTYDTTIYVEGDVRSDIEKVFDVFESHVDGSKLPEEARPTVFIGHGRNTLWRDLKDHLHEQHGIEVEAYETGARAGHVIRDILEDMARKSTFAILVMTGEDDTGEGASRARQNVVHEVGLFQGRLGFSRAIAVVEDGVELFSNLDGVQQIRFAKGNIKETYGDILATIRREFGEG